MAQRDIQTVYGKLRLNLPTALYHTSTILTLRWNYFRDKYILCARKTAFGEMSYSFAVDHNPLVLFHNRRNNNNNNNNNIVS